MNNLYVMIGCPGSGKSTYVKNIIKNDPSIIWISRDEIRFSLVNENEPYFSKEKEVFEDFTYKINDYLEGNYDVVADATHLNQSSRLNFLIIYILIKVEPELQGLLCGRRLMNVLDGIICERELEPVYLSMNYSKCIMLFRCPHIMNIIGYLMKLK